MPHATRRHEKTNKKSVLNVGGDHKARPAGLVERRGHATAAQLRSRGTANYVRRAVHNLYTPACASTPTISHAFVLWQSAVDPDRDGAALWRPLGHGRADVGAVDDYGHGELYASAAIAGRS